MTQYYHQDDDDNEHKKKKKNSSNDDDNNDHNIYYHLYDEFVINIYNNVSTHGHLSEQIFASFENSFVT